MGVVDAALKRNENDPVFAKIICDCGFQTSGVRIQTAIDAMRDHHKSTSHPMPQAMQISDIHERFSA